MDPNATLSRLRELSAEITKAFHAGDNATDMGAEMADLFDALDQWITRGGFLPTDWNRK